MGCFLDFASNDLGDELSSQLRESTTRRFTLYDLHHLLSNCTDLGGCGIGRLFDLIWTSFGEGDSEQAKQVIICSLDRDVRFDQRLPFPYQGS